MVVGGEFGALFEAEVVYGFKNQGLIAPCGED